MNPSKTTFVVRADPDPTLLTRVAAVLSTLDLLPHRLVLNHTSDNLVSVTIYLYGVSESLTDLLERNLMRLPQLHDAKLQNQPSPE